MKKMSVRILSLLLVLLMCVPTVLTAVASGDGATNEGGEETAQKTDYSALYVKDVDEDGTSDLHFLYDAFDVKKTDEAPKKLVDRLGNELDISKLKDVSYADGGLKLNGQALNLSSVYDASWSEFFVQTVIAQTGERPATGGTTVVGPASISVQTNNLTDPETGEPVKNKKPIDETYGIVSGTYWEATLTDGKTKEYATDVDWKQIRFLGAPVGRMYSVGVTVEKSITATAPSFVVNYVRDFSSVVTTAALSYDATKDTGITLFLNFDVVYHAIRLYSKIPTAAQMKQNHFADLATAVQLDLTAYNKLTEDERTILYDVCANISLSDPDLEYKVASAFTDVIISSLYVRDVDGNGTDDSTLLWSAFDKQKGDSVSEMAFSTAAGAKYGDGYLFNDSKDITLTSYLPNFSYGNQTAQKDFTVEAVMSANAPTALDPNLADTGDWSASGSWYFGNFTGSFKYRYKDSPNIAQGPIYAWVYMRSFDASRASNDEAGFSINRNGNYLLSKNSNEIFTTTISIDLTLGETPDKTKDTMLVGLYYNAQNLQTPALKEAVAYDAANTNDKLAFGLGSALNYYAIRVYQGVLSEAQMKQNHFADLMAYYRPTELTYFSELSNEGKGRVRALCENLPLGGTESELALKAAIQSVYREEKDEIYLAEYFMNFDGYAVHLFGDNDMRASYSLNDAYIAALPEHVKILEIGLLTTKVGAEQGNERLKKGSLTLDYVEKNDFAEKNVFYSGNEGESLASTYHAVISCGNEAKAHAQNYMVRGYVTIEVKGKLDTLYEDATSSALGDTVSLASVSAAAYEDIAKEYVNHVSGNVLEGVLLEAETILSTIEKTVKDAEEARVGAENALADAKALANNLKDALKKIAADGAAEGADKAKLKAEAATLLADVAAIEAKARTEHPKLDGVVTPLIAEAENITKLVDLASNALDRGDALFLRGAALVEAVKAESKLQEEKLSNGAQRASVDALIALSVSEKLGARIAAGNFGEAKTLRVLAIANSFSNNATTQLYEIASHYGYEDILIGVMYIGNCAISGHYENARYNYPKYDYRKTSNGTWYTYSQSTLYEGVTDEAWDIFIFQESSHNPAIDTTPFENGQFDYLTNYVRTNMENKDAKFYFHQTWAYADQNAAVHKGEPGYEYLDNQAQMDALIMESMKNVVSKREDLDGIIYAGVSVAEARKHFGTGFELYAGGVTNGVVSDGYHLNNKGQYVIGLTWFGTLTGEDISTCPDVKVVFGGVTADHAAAVAAALKGVNFTIAE